MKPAGLLLLISVGPGSSDLIPPAAREALERCDTIVGYELYLQWIRPWLAPTQTIITLPLTQEKERAQVSIEAARAGQTVGLVSSGDIGVYAMAALAFELLDETDDFAVQVIPGISAANSCASLLGSPLSHDFATLSLSNLLCPWEWIEHRARHLAQADMAIALYNVQSKTRTEGVYRIIEICREFKSADVWCGVVRNAYRPDQEIKLCQLGELDRHRFDMLTTIIIGNRFTRRKKQFLFTPRGYLGWEQTPDPAPVSGLTVPCSAAWVFSGTADGNALASELSKRGWPVVISTATTYGAELARTAVPSAFVISGSQGEEARTRLLRDHTARVIIDATHPFATEITSQLGRVAEVLGIPYLRYERPLLPREEGLHYVPDPVAAATLALQLGRRIFLATGKKDLGRFSSAPHSENATWFVRITPDVDSLQAVLAAGIPRANICALQGPVSQEVNEALWKSWSVDCVVTKDSGAEGGFAAKVEAARRLQIPLIAIERPSPPSRAGQSFDQILLQLPSLMEPSLL